MSTALRRILTDISRVEGVRGVVIVSKDGLVLDAVIPGRDIDAEDLGASLSQAVNLMAKIGGQFELGGLTIMSLEFDDGLIVVGDLGDNFVLVIADKNALVGMIRNEIKKSKEKLKALVG